MGDGPAVVPAPSSSMASMRATTRWPALITRPIYPILHAMHRARQAPIVIALSGGVDSATAAGLLVEAGERVVGITMRLYDARGTAASSSGPGGGRCCGPRDIEDARRVAAHLGIPFYVANDSEVFARR